MFAYLYRPRPLLVLLPPPHGPPRRLHHTGQLREPLLSPPGLPRPHPRPRRRRYVLLPPPPVPPSLPTVVRTRFDEDGRPIPAKSLSVSVRCYQSRLTRTRSFRSTLVVDHTDVLWVKPPDKDYADVGELEFPFKITLPKRIPGFSTANYQDYRVFWRLEASKSSHSVSRLPPPSAICHIPRNPIFSPASFISLASPRPCTLPKRRLPYRPLLRSRPRTL